MNTQARWLKQQEHRHRLDNKPCCSSTVKDLISVRRLLLLRLTIKLKLHGYYVTKNQCMRLLIVPPFVNRSLYVNKGPERQKNMNLVISHIHLCSCQSEWWGYNMIPEFFCNHRWSPGIVNDEMKFYGQSLLIHHDVLWSNKTKSTVILFNSLIF